MNSCFRMAVSINTVVLMAASVYGKAEHACEAEPNLSIHLYDQAHVPSGLLHLATEETTRLMKAAGIRIRWEQPFAEAPEDRGTDMTSAQFGNPDERSYLVVRLIRATPLAMLPGALGYALPFASKGAHVSIFFDRVETFRVTPNIPTYVILGHAMAHEIGHVLLRSSAHSEGGLMQERWNAATWRLATAGLLSFRREEAESMCAALGRSNYAAHSGDANSIKEVRP